jgi:hypothetical protein
MAVSAAVADYLAAWDQHAGARQRAEGVVHMVRQAAEALGDWQGAAEIIATRTASFWPAGLAFLKPPNGASPWLTKDEIATALQEWARAHERLVACWQQLPAGERGPLKSPEPPARE